MSGKSEDSTKGPRANLSGSHMMMTLPFPQHPARERRSSRPLHQHDDLMASLGRPLAGGDTCYRVANAFERPYHLGMACLHLFFEGDKVSSPICLLFALFVLISFFFRDTHWPRKESPGFSDGCLWFPILSSFSQLFLCPKSPG